MSPLLVSALVILTISHSTNFCFADEATAKAAGQTAENAKTVTDVENSRSKRELSEDDDFGVAKRVRDFVGKRSTEDMYSGPEINDATSEKYSELLDSPVDVLVRPGANAYDRYDSANKDGEFGGVDKRLRDFVGKRDWQPSEQKRLRDFVGKRSEEDIVKRLRDFVGKRGAFDDGYFQENKRPRQFVGKRSDWEDPLAFSKRLRDFVGKRDWEPRYMEPEKRFRDFVGKRSDLEDYAYMDKRLRDFVGKRSEAQEYGLPDYNNLGLMRDILEHQMSPSYNRYIANSMSKDKRIRDFVGKRQVKRLRDFVGKRSMENVGLNKRVREFIGKRSEDLALGEEKRLRDFVGKRSEEEAESEELFSTMKRLRDFVGKRSVAKRVREFVGRR